MMLNTKFILAIHKWYYGEEVEHDYQIKGWGRVVCITSELSTSSKIVHRMVEFGEENWKFIVTTFIGIVALIIGFLKIS
jgi:hypothetical protein